MKKFIKLTLVLVMVLGSTSLFAQKFGRIDSQSILMMMPETKEMQANLETLAKDYRENLELISVEYQQKLQEFQKNYNTYSEATRNIKQKELADLENRARTIEQMAQQDMEKKQQELLTPITEKMRQAIDKVSKAGAFTAVFETAMLVYFDAAQMVDIAPLVKAELGIKEVAAATPAAAPAK